MALGYVAQRVARTRAARTDDVQLVVEDEQIRWCARRGECVGNEHVRGPHVEEAAEDLVHREERGRHATARREKLAPADAQLLRRARSQFECTRLDALLLLGLCLRHVFAVRHHLRRNRRAQILHVIGRRQLGELLVAKPSVVFAEFRLVCRVAHGFSPPESIHCNAQQSLRTEIPLATDGFARGIEAFFDRFATPASTRLLDRSEFPIGSQFRTTRDPSRVKKSRTECSAFVCPSIRRVNNAIRCSSIITSIWARAAGIAQCAIVKLSVSFERP